MKRPDQTEPLEQLLTVEDVARIVGLGRSAAYELIGRIPGAVRIGIGLRLRLRMPHAALEHWIQQGGDRKHHAASTAPAPVSKREASRAPSQADQTDRSSWREQFPGYNPSRARKRKRATQQT